jgi:hypothetical protein
MPHKRKHYDSYHFVQENMNIARVEVVHEILATNLLSPVMAKPTLKAISQPKRMVVVAVSSSLAPAVVTI